jgi:hypothetical protein
MPQGQKKDQIIDTYLKRLQMPTTASTIIIPKNRTIIQLSKDLHSHLVVSARAGDTDQ